MGDSVEPRRIRQSVKAILGLGQLDLVWSKLSKWAASMSSAARSAANQRRIFVLAPFAFISGIIAYRLVWAEPGIAVLVIGTIAIGLFGWLVLRSYSARRWWTLTVLAWVGFWALPLHAALFGTDMLASPRYGHYEFRIDGVLYDDGEDQRWVISEIATGNQRDDPGVRRARILAPGGFAVAPGDIVAARVRFYPVPPPVFPGGYDAQFAGFYAGIGAYGSLLGDPETLDVRNGGLLRLIDDVRSEIGRRIQDVLGSRIGGVAMALINGDQSRVTEEDWDTMALVGLAHVLSISGLHLTLVAGTMFISLRLILSLPYGLAQRWPVKNIAAAGGIFVAIAYMLISGLQVPAIRSTIMLVLVFGAVLAGRQALTMRNVAIAGLLLAALDPASVFRPSYQLSFAAVVALIAAFEMARVQRLEKGSVRNKTVAMFIDVTMTSLVAGGATLMFTAFHFQQTAPFGVLGNLLATPLVSFVMMPSALFAMLLMPFGLEAPLLIVMGWSIEAMIWIAHWVGVLSGGFDPSPLLAPSALAVSLAALAWLAFFQNNVRLIGPVFAVPIIFLFCTERVPDVLIADSTQALVVRHEGELSLMAGRNNTFATNVWSERYMEPISNGHEDASCDLSGCILKSSHGYMVALVRQPSAFPEDCAIADLVVTRIGAPEWCREATTVVDAANLYANGPHMAYWNDAAQTFELRAAMSDLNRAWRRDIQ